MLQDFSKIWVLLGIYKGHSDKAKDILKSLKVGDLDQSSKPADWQVDKD